MATNKNPFKINGVELPKVKSCSMAYQDLSADTSGRTADGIMHIDYIRRNVMKFELEFVPMTTDDLAIILRLIDAESFSFTYRDPKNNNNERTITCYVGDRNLDYYRTGYKVVPIDNTNPVQYRVVDMISSLKLSIIEY